MSGYNHKCFIKSFADRTMRNYEFILEMKAKKQEVFDVTQLMNSLFGLLILPFEKYKQHGANSVAEDELKMVVPEEYNSIRKIIQQLKDDNRLMSTYGECDEKYPVGRFIKHLRNAIAHSGEEGLQFFPYDENGEITSVYFYDNLNEREFCTKITVDEIIELVKLISKMYVNYEKHTSIDNSYCQVKAQVEKYNKLLKQK